MSHPAVLTPLPTGDAVTALANGWLATVSERTRESYLPTIRQWDDWLGQRDRPLLEATRPDVTDWVDYLSVTRGLYPGTVNGKISTVSSFYRYVVLEHVLPFSPTDNVRKLREDAESTRQAPTADQVSLMLEAAQMEGGREYLLTCLLALMGLRVSEALSLRRSNRRTKGGRQVLAFIGKGDRAAILAMPEPVLHAWNAVEPLVAGEDPMLGSDLTRWGASRYIRSLARNVGIVDRHITPHSLRHAFASIQLEAGAPYREVQQAMRHSSDSTTARYDRNKLDAQSRGVDRLAGLLVA